MGGAFAILKFGASTDVVSMWEIVLGDLGEINATVVPVGRTIGVWCLVERRTYVEVWAGYDPLFWIFCMAGVRFYYDFFNSGFKKWSRMRIAKNTIAKMIVTYPSIIMFSLY